MHGVLLIMNSVKLKLLISFHLTCFEMCGLCLDSPMDMSMVEGEDRPATVNEVPEYAAEIHTYLREMEVNWAPISKCIFPCCRSTDVYVF